MLVLASVCQSVSTEINFPKNRKEINFSWNLLVFFSEILHRNKNLKTEKAIETDFPGKIPVCLKISKKDPKRVQKLIFLTIEKFCHYFLLEVTKSKSQSCSLFSCANLISEKILVCNL